MVLCHLLWQALAGQEGMVRWLVEKCGLDAYL